jgi:hypothetical protein
MDMMHGTQIKSNGIHFKTKWIIANVVLACYWMINDKINAYNYKLHRILKEAADDQDSDLDRFII